MSDSTPTQLAWAYACKMRSRATEIRIDCGRAAREGVTRRERRLFAQVERKADELEEVVRSLQASLSERSKLEGRDSPAPRVEVEW